MSPRTGLALVHACVGLAVLTGGGCSSRPAEGSGLDIPAGPARTPVLTPSTALTRPTVGKRASVSGLPLGLHDMPAISHDGTRVVVDSTPPRGARGYSDASFALIQMVDGARVDHVILAAALVEATVAGQELTPPLAARIAAAQALLDGTKWHRMLPLTYVGDAPTFSSVGQGATMELAASQLRVSFDAPTLSVRRSNGTVESLSIRQEHHGWVVRASRPLFEGCDPTMDDCYCTNPPYLKAAYFEPGHGALLLAIGYRGTDRCPEPSIRHHVLRLFHGAHGSPPADGTRDPATR